MMTKKDNEKLIKMRINYLQMMVMNVNQILKMSKKARLKQGVQV